MTGLLSLQLMRMLRNQGLSLLRMPAVIRPLCVFLHNFKAWSFTHCIGASWDVDTIESPKKPSFHFPCKIAKPMVHLYGLAPVRRVLRATSVPAVTHELLGRRQLLMRQKNVEEKKSEA